MSWLSESLFVLIHILAFIFFFYIAKKIGLQDIPNSRSSHQYKSYRGAGIVFVTMIFFSFLFETQTTFELFIAFSLLALLSFLDDIFSFPVSFRLLGYILFSALYLYSLDLPILYFLFTLIFMVGFINIYNFMDGINGILAIQLIIAFASIILIDLNQAVFFPIVMKSIFISLVCFLYFNFRKKALCFAGDVGSIAMSFLLFTFILEKIIDSQNISWILLSSVFLVDGTATIVWRGLKKQYIWQAHRSHLYQFLANNCAIDQRKIALCYGLVQCMVNGLIYMFALELNLISSIYFTLLVFLFLFIIYILLWKVLGTLYKEKIS